MKAEQFDFARWEDFAAAREASCCSFLEGTGENNVLLVQNWPSRFTVCRTPEESLEMQLDAIACTMNRDFPTDVVPYLEPWFGVGVYANAAGAKYVWTDNQSPQTHYIAHTEDEMDAVAFDNDRSEAMQLILRAIDYFTTETKGRVPICATDTQSPIDTATLIVDTSVLFTALYTAPGRVHALLQKITASVIAFTRTQAALLGEAWARPGHLSASVRGGRGMALSDDNIVMMSPGHYSEFAVPYNEQIGRAFGGLSIHSCGNYEQQLPALLATEGLLQVDGAFMKEAVDPHPNLNYRLWRQAFKDGRVVLRARMNDNWEEPLRQLYHPGMRIVLEVPCPASGEPAGKNRERLNRLLDELRRQREPENMQPSTLQS
ncbi:MAG TPA: uroporphyrinogen decarboxylase family protein [Lentisphaeria bacterium]|nr:uroporphyrinogen decarboxylase family protein [Lentisphaeria bacterium]